MGTLAVACARELPWVSRPRAIARRPRRRPLNSKKWSRRRSGKPGEIDVAVAFHDLATGNELLIHADVNFHPASTIKIPIMMEVFRQAEEKGLFA